MSFEQLLEAAHILGGDKGVTIIKALGKVGKCTDDKLALKTKIDLNELRRILYILHSHSLITVERVRDDKTGWFTFYWKPKLNGVEGFILSRKGKVLEKLELRLVYEKSHDFYRCKHHECKQIMPFEKAVELFFKCFKCGSALEHFDNKLFIDALEKRIRILKDELSL